MTRRWSAVLLGLLALGGSADAAQWQGTQTAITSTAENATLGVSGRSAAVDPAGRIHLVYQRNPEGESFQILYTVRETNGTWSPAMVLSDPRGARNATVLTDGDGRVHVFWEDLITADGEIGHRVREADGIWGPIEIVAPAAGFSRHPVAAIDVSDRLHVVWSDGRTVPQRILHAVQIAPGSWSTPDILSKSAVIPQDPTVAADRIGGVHVAWVDRGIDEARRSSWGVLYVRLGLEPGIPDPVRIIDHSGSALRPFLEALPDGTVHLIWLDNRNSPQVNYYEIYVKRSLPGIGWGKDKRFTYDQTDHGQPIVVYSGAGRLNVVWEDYRNGAPDLLYRQITPETGWDRDVTRLTADATSSQAPSLAALPDGKLFLFWTDTQGSGIFRIFYKEGAAALP
jgi:hypothetical protein